MLWACLHFSDLPLHAVFDVEERRQRCALVDGPRQRQHVVSASASARQCGVRAQQPVAAARALCANLLVRPRDRAAECRLLHSLAAWAYRFSSHVSLSEPDALLIEVGASLRLFGGWPRLERRLQRALARIDFEPAITVAPIPAAARVLAMQHAAFFTDQREPMITALGHVPLLRSGLGDNAISLLYNVGMRTLRDAFALPRAELAKRIGQAGLATLDRMRGIEHEVLPLYQPPDSFEHHIDLDDRIEAWPPLLFPLRRLCNELALFLTARDGGVQRCELALDHEDHGITRIVVELLTPQREARLLYDLVRSRLERVALAQPVCGIALIARDLPTLRPQHQDLFEPKRAQALDWNELAERLRAHLGDAAVRRLASAADHRPEKAWRFASEDPSDLRSGNPGKPHSRSSPLPLAGEAAPQARVRVAHEETATSKPPPHSNSSPLPLAGEAAPQTRVRVAHEETATSKPPPHSDSSPLPLAGEAAPQARVRVAREEAATSKPPPHSDSSPLPLAGEAAPQARVRVAHEETATSEPPPHSENATLTPTLSHQREKSFASIRPLWLLSRAIPLRGPSPRILAGPERIESGWWDGADARRDYYVVQTRNGQRAWAFLAAGATDGWMLHGWFA